MSELGYRELIPGIYGTPNPATDSSPASIAALQESVTQAMIVIAETSPTYVPQSYEGNPGQGPSNQQAGGPSNLPIRGWTAQNTTGPAFIEPYDATDMGHIPDWTGDPNSIAAGQYDMNPVVAADFVDPLNVAPIGDGLLQFDDTQTNPNIFPEDGGSLVGDFEY
jgi:hypothetical protein